MAETLRTSELTSDEIELARAALAKMQPGRLPLDVFLEVARLTVTPTIEVVPLRTNAQGRTEVLLTRREDSDPIWGGMLHTPGSVIRASDREGSCDDAFIRILSGELRGVPTSAPVFVESRFHQIKRGMELAQVHYAEVLGGPEIGEFYEAGQLPDNVVDSQLDFIQAAVQTYETARAARG